MNTKRKGLLQKVLMLVLVLCLVCGNGLMALANEAVASSMRLTKTEGTVSVTNKNGRDMGTMADMKLFNGYHLSTEQKSYAWMNLDDHKLIKLDAVSEAEIQKKGKDLEVLLNSGNLLFNVSENLKADETLNIRTSTMVTGIRGTCGWVKVIDSYRTQVYILEGQVQCYVMDPVTGQYKSVVLRSGETAEFVVYDQTRVGDKCDILVNRFSEKNIPGFVAVELMNDSDLSDRVAGSMNLDMNWISGNGPAILNQDQTNVAQKFTAVNEAMKQQDHKVKKDPLFGNEDDGDNGGGGGNGTVTPPDEPTEPDDPTPPTEPTDLTEITLTVAEAEADDQLNFYLSMETMETVTIVSDAPDVLNISDATTLSSNQQLILTDGVGLQVDSGAELRINGELSTTDGNITNYGTITNTNMYSLKVGADLNNEDGAIIENTGRIVIGNLLNNSGEITSSGLLIGSVTVEEGGRLDIFSNDTDLQDVEKGPLTVTADTDGYVALYSDMPDFVSIGMNGGTVEFAGANQELLEVDNGHVIVSNGSTIGELHVQNMESTVTVNTGGMVEKLFTTSSTVTVDGGTVTELTEVRGEVSGDGTTTATEPSIVTVNDGNVTAITMDRGDLTVSGGAVEAATVNGLIQVSGGSIDTLTLVNARYLSDAVNIVNALGTVKLENGKILEANLEGGNTEITGEGISVLMQSEGEVTLERGAIVDHIVLNGANGIVRGGDVKEGIVVAGEGTMLTVEGGNIHAPQNGAAITVDSAIETDENGDPIRDENYDPSYNVIIKGGIIDGGSDTAILVKEGYALVENTATVKAKTVEGLIQVDTSNGAWVDIPWIETDGGIPAEMSDVSLLLCDMSNSEYILKKAEASLSEALGDAEAGSVISLITEEVFADSTGYRDSIYILEDTKATIDLNGNTLYIDTDIVIERATSEDGNDGSIEFIDSAGDGQMRVSSSFNNSGILKLTGIDSIFFGDSYNYGTMVIDGGKHEFHGPINVDLVMDEEGNRMSGAVTVTGGANLVSSEVAWDGEFVSYALSPAIRLRTGGLLTLGKENDKYPVVLSSLVSNPDPGYGIIEIGAGTAEFTNVEADLDGCAVAISYLDGDISENTYIEIDDKAVLKSNNDTGSIVLTNQITKLSLNGGIICNSAPYGAAISTSYDSTYDIENDEEGTLLSDVKTQLYAKNYIVALMTGDGILEEYDSDAYTRSSETIKSGEYKGYYELVSIPAVRSLVMSATAGSAPSNSSLPETTASNATSSNASGTPTPSKSAIPMAVAMLAGLMAIAPKLFEDSENKYRKER